MNKNSRKSTRTIEQIERGTVIDHIDPHVVFTVVRILGIDDTIRDTVTVGTNFHSNAIGRKGIIKIANHFLTSEDVNKLSVISPNATVNIIDDYEVKQKFKVSFPEVVEKILKCPNPNCVTNVEKIATKFRLVNQEPLLLFCTYCERYIQKQDIEVL